MVRLADWLLTKNGTFLRSVTVKHGFPARGGGIEAAQRARRKAAFGEWLAVAAGVPGLAEALHRVRALPPARFGDAAWAFVVATMKILPQAASALDEVFRTRGQRRFRRSNVACAERRSARRTTRATCCSRSITGCRIC